METIPNGTKVYVDASNGVYTGTILSSGTQGCVLFYKIQLIDTTAWPDEISQGVIIVHYSQVRYIIQTVSQLPPMHGFTNIKNLITSQPNLIT